MKALLWILIVVFSAINVATSFAFDGGKQVAISVSTGVVVLASVAGLIMMRVKQRS